MYDDGTVWTGGSNNRGQLGIGGYLGAYHPALSKVVLPAGRKAVNIYITETDPTAGATGVNGAIYNNGYFVLDDGSVYGAGANNFGQLGVGTTYDYTTTPVKMDLPTGVKAASVISCYGTTIILTTTGKVYSVGSNAYGQLGTGTTGGYDPVPKANAYLNMRSTISY
jgi:alpha-tubulin suppressor-like RCC1 family protein